MHSHPISSALLTLVLSLIPLTLLTSCANDSGQPLETRTGLASFYGKAFQGQTTASGEPFHMNDLVAAHPSYPPGTRVRVTNLENNQSVEVRITDKGPTEENREEGVIIDLSKAAAKELGM